MINKEDSDFLNCDEMLRIDEAREMLFGDYDKVTITRDKIKEFVNNSSLDFRGYEKPKTLIKK